ncbi:TPA: amino acid ABC transporter permease [Streptococcus suis]|nr:amino acid ABC transporter permease [Streptococcus suis]
MDISYMIEILPRIVVYLPVTIIMAVSSMIIALLLGVVLTYLYNQKWSKWFIELYLLVFRGFPTIVILFVIYFGIPQVIGFGSGWSAMLVSVFALGLKQAAYSLEIFRSGIVSIDKGQLEAGVSIGLSPFQVYRRIIFPQALRIIIPPLGNNFIGLLKETSLAFSIGVTEIFGEGKMIASQNFRYFEVYFLVGVLYVLVIYVYSILQEFLEEKLNYY